LDPGVSGFARADVVVPSGLPFAPLPIRLAPQIIQFPTGRFRGVWSWAELTAAADLGCSVSVSDCWAPSSSSDLFGGWWDICQIGRAELPEGALDLFKAITNSLWGQFAMDGTQRALVRWTDDKGEDSLSVDQPPRHLPHAWTVHIAAETAARVRTRLLLEGLYGQGGAPVHADTDGIIVRRSRPLPARSSEAPGDWRLKATMPKVDIRAPQVYRWTCGKGCGVTHPRWHYTASGIPKGSAATFFEEQPVTRVSYRSWVEDVNVPTCHTDDRAQREHLLLEARALAGLA
jgi:hypothetical protein